MFDCGFVENVNQIKLGHFKLGLLSVATMQFSEVQHNKYHVKIVPLTDYSKRLVHCKVNLYHVV